MTRARSTNARSFTDSVWDRMMRAVDAQLVMPMTTTMMYKVIRIPKNSEVVPKISRRIGARMRARTKVGRTRKKSVMRMSVVSTQPPMNPLTIPTNTPMATVTTVASSPMIIDTRAPWNVRLRMSRPSSSVPRMCSASGAARRSPVAVVAVSSGPTKAAGAMASTAKTPMMNAPTSPSGRRRNLTANSRQPRRRRRSCTQRASVGVTVPAVMSAPADRASRR
jgi:hypothetical protein